jgi:hypothetical protein
MKVACWRCKKPFDNNVIDTGASVGTCPRCYEDFVPKHRPEAEAELRSEDEKQSNEERAEPFESVTLTAPRAGSPAPYEMELRRPDAVANTKFTPDEFVRASVYVLTLIERSLPRPELLTNWVKLRNAVAIALKKHIPDEAGLTIEALETLLDRTMMLVIERADAAKADLAAQAKSVAA